MEQSNELSKFPVYKEEDYLNNNNSNVDFLQVNFSSNGKQHSYGKFKRSKVQLFNRNYRTTAKDRISWNIFGEQGGFFVNLNTKLKTQTLNYICKNVFLS